MSAPYDTRIEMVTPENIAFQYRVAGPFRRFPAYIMDIALQIAIVGLVFFAGTFVFSFAGLWGLGPAIGLISLFVVSWFYGGLFETFWNGQTPGKRLMQIRVLSADGQPVSGMQAVLRNLLRTVDGLPLIFLWIPSYLAGFIGCSMNNRFQRLGDLAAGTMVVVEEPQRRYGVVRITERAVLELAVALPPSFEASRALAQALSAYVARRQNFSFGRRIEIARHLAEPLRERFHLPPGTNYDLLLCAAYHRVFFGWDSENVAPMGTLAEMPASAAQGTPTVGSTT